MGAEETSFIEWRAKAKDERQHKQSSVKVIVIAAVLAVIAIAAILYLVL
ncbi:hypothetical protein [Solihabitans fulvus]|nr:hypothetical protein [Solihabitans fulvus]